MTSKQAQEKIGQACEDAIAEARKRRWSSAERLLRGAADVAAAVDSPSLRGALTSTAMNGDLPDEPRYSQSLARGLQILTLFTAEESVWGISDISDKLGFSRSTAHRYLITLQRLGQIEQTDHRKYRLVMAD